MGADGTVETITGTTIHPVWSVDRQEWVPLSELAEGETLHGLDGFAVVLSVTLSRVTQPLYKIEVHGEHVYQVGELGVVVHNTCPHVDGGVASSHNVLQGAITFLRSGYRDMGKGRFLSADGLRQIRWGIHELNPLDMHIHFEHYDLPWDIEGKVIELIP